MLEAKLPRVARDALLVLHAMGSHGPTYFRRVTPDHEPFKPTCPTERIETCSDAQIVNSYDNSIAYTDYVLAGLIDQLAAQQDRLDSVLLYVSDHGESLGENGLYLHGQPYLIAPDVQTKVPMLLWFSRDATARLQLDHGLPAWPPAGPLFTRQSFAHPAGSRGRVNVRVSPRSGRAAALPARNLNCV